MLNDDRRRNLQARAEVVATSVHRAWMHFQVLKGMQQATADDPENLLTHPLAFDAIYRAVFDALYVAVGAITDTRSDVESLHTLAQMARRYPLEPGVGKFLQATLLSVQVRDGSPLHRLKSWRDKHAAHRTLEAATPEFYAENRLDLTEIEQAISILDTAFSDMTYALLGQRYELRTSTESIASNCAALLIRYDASNSAPLKPRARPG